MSRPVVIDTDPGCDDAAALLLALERPELEVVGLSTVHGNAPVEDTTRNARAILELFDRTDVSVASGATKPLTVDLETAEDIHGEGGISGELPTPTAGTEPVDVHAAQYLVETARAHAGDLTLIALGPLTNVALAVALEPDLPDLIDELVVMGGAAFSPGNVTPLAEANFHSDPHAAARVVREFAPTIVGLDVTIQATLPPEWLESFPREDSLSRSIYAWLTYYSTAKLEQYDLGSTAIHDALAIAGVIDPTVLETEAHYLTVGTDSEFARGALVCDVNSIEGNPPNGSVAVDADIDRFRDLLIDAVDSVLKAESVTDTGPDHAL